MKKSVLVGVVLAMAVMTGCVKTTRVTMDKDGNKTGEVTSWEPLTPVVYGGPVVYADGYYPPATVVVEQPYYRPAVVVERPYRVYREPHYVRTFYIGGRPHHHGHRHHR